MEIFYNIANGDGPPLHECMPDFDGFLFKLVFGYIGEIVYWRHVGQLGRCRVHEL
jgi:hypothetical protein